MGGIRTIESFDVPSPGAADNLRRKHEPGLSIWLGRVTGSALITALILAGSIVNAFAAPITWSVPAGNQPFAVAVNETTNRAYVANNSSSNVTVIDGSGSTTTIAAGTFPGAVAVNEITNRAYVANQASNDVTVIDGSGSTTTITAGTIPRAVAVNETTNRAYVANNGSSDVTIIDGSGFTTTIAAGTNPCAVAVNETTNKAYVANQGSNDVTVIDGSGSTTTITAGTTPSAVAVNETTNRAYVANQGSSNVTVIDGSGSTTTVSAGTTPYAVAVNETTNRAYVANYSSNNVTVIDGAGSTTTIAAGTNPFAVAVNENTNKAYVANNNSNNVTVIDGSGSTTTIAAGTNPNAVVVNETTNRAYVANNNSNNVTVIDGSGSTSAVSAGTAPWAVAVNETTNKAYVANSSSNNVTVIDGAGSTSTIAAGTNPCAVAVNETTDKAYVANWGSNNVTVIDGSGSTTTIAAGTNPQAIAVNQTTNKAYVANYSSHDVTVIDGSGSTTTVSAGTSPYAVAVNETTDRAYVANNSSNNVTVIDGAGSTTTVAAGTSPYAVAVNETTNKAYVANDGSNNVTVIDGAGSTSTVSAGTNPRAVAVNETTNKAYVANAGSNNVTVIDGAGSTTTIAAGTYPRGVAVNETANRAYVANWSSNNVTVIDGAGSTSTVAAGTNPDAVAVNETTNKTYVANAGSGNVTVIAYSSPATLTTTAPTGITANAASSGGNITSDGGDPVSLRGVCWSTSPDPTTHDSHTMDGTGAGSYTSSITGLSPGTLYHLRAYSINGAGTSYGGDQPFTTADTPTVTTTAPSNITPTTASSGGDVTSDGGAAVTARGVCWSMSPNPTIAASKTSDGTGTGSFTSSLTGLTPSSTYHVRAYATNSVGTSYGADRTFDTPSTPPPPPPEASHTWYLAEGTTAWGFNTYISIANPNDTSVEVIATYMPKGAGNVAEKITLPANSQTTLTNDHLIQKMGGTYDFSTLVEATDHSKTIAVDRTMEWGATGTSGKGSSPEGHSSVGVTSPAKTWYLPEGSTNWSFETWLLIQNPSETEASCDVTYMIEGEGPKTVNHKVPANSRESYSMLTDVGNADASIEVVSNQPVIPERAMYRYDRREGHDSIGTTTPAADYYLAEGAVGYDSNYTTYVLVQNPQNSPTEVTVTYLTGTGQVPGPSFTMDPNSRKTVKVNDTLPANTDVSTSVHGSAPIIAERAMYWDSPAGEACHDSVGMSTPADTFYLPDGQTSEGRETWTLVQNPNPIPVEVRVSYLLAGGGTPVSFTDIIGPNSRKTYNMAGKLPSGRASILVQSIMGGPVMCERAIYWSSRSAGTDTIGGSSD